MGRYTRIPIKRNKAGVRYYRGNKYPNIPRSDADFYVYPTNGDRYDILALNFYGDKDLWWIISAANGNIDKATLHPPVGEQLRIPGNFQAIVNAYNELND
tara:strand:- start:1699 stop:1998 length:300 start_codon:yes stop_codon:yes gene_type:complete